MNVSVIVPIYNVEQYVETCLISIERQTLRDIEVIVVDDGSTDRSSEVAMFYCDRNPNFRYIKKDNGGLMSAWTLGVKESHGDYIGFVDSDDYVKPEMFDRLYKTAIRENADIVYCDYIDNNGLTYTTDILHEGLYTGTELDSIRPLIFPVPGRGVISNARWNKLFRRSMILDNLIYTECQSRTFEDRYIVPAAIMSAASFYYLKDPLYIYTVDRNNSNSKQYKPNLLEEIKRFYYIQGQMLKDKGLNERYQQDWESVYINYIRQYVTRNIVGVMGYKKRLISARNLFVDELTGKRLLKYAHLCNSRLERTTLLTYRLKSPLLLAIASYLA